MKLANLGGRQVIITGSDAEGWLAIDLIDESNGRITSDWRTVYEQWDQIRTIADGATSSGAPFEMSELGPPSPSPAKCSPSAQLPRTRRGS